MFSEVVMSQEKYKESETGGFHTKKWKDRPLSTWEGGKGGKNCMSIKKKREISNAVL